MSTSLYYFLSNVRLATSNFNFCLLTFKYTVFIYRENRIEQNRKYMFSDIK